MKHNMSHEHWLIPRAIADTTSSTLRMAAVRRPNVIAATEMAPAIKETSEWLNGLCARLPVALSSGA